MDLLSIIIVLPLRISYKWNHTLHSLLCLAFSLSLKLLSLHFVAYISSDLFLFIDEVNKPKKKKKKDIEIGEKEIKLILIEDKWLSKNEVEFTKKATKTNKWV